MMSLLVQLVCPAAAEDTSSESQANPAETCAETEKRPAEAQTRQSPAPKRRKLKRKQPIPQAPRERSSKVAARSFCRTSKSYRFLRRMTLPLGLWAIQLFRESRGCVLALQYSRHLRFLLWHRFDHARRAYAWVCSEPLRAVDVPDA